VADLPQAGEIDDDRLAVRQGRGAAAQSGVAALGHDGHADGHTGLHHGGNLGGVGGQDNGLGRTGVAAPPVGEVRRGGGCVSEAVGWADEGTQGVEQGHGGLQ
jgi:hypothetical protein